VSHAAVSGNYFETLGIKLVAGRTFDERDKLDAPRTVIVSTKFAEKNWPHENPLGHRLVYGWGLNTKESDWFTIVGVVTPTVQGEFERDMVDAPQTYVPYTQQRDGARFLTVFTQARGGGEAASLATVVRQTVRELDADQPIYWPQTLEEMVADAWFYKRLIAWIFGIFGGVALVLAAVGLYGVMSYSVSQRTQEIGVRMALGAEPRDVLAMILREGGLRLAVGLALGLGVAYYAGKLLAFILYGVEPGDTTAFVATAFALGATGLIACLVPALRAVHVNPVEALRCE
jgi:predicted permease